MKITFKNVGAIEQTELDLRPMTVIIGPNNSNKTYIAYLIYGLWKDANTGWEVQFLPKITKERENEHIIKLNEEFYSTIIKIFESNTFEFQKSLKTFFQDSSSKIFSNTSINILIDRYATPQSQDSKSVKLRW